MNNNFRLLRLVFLLVLLFAFVSIAPGFRAVQSWVRVDVEYSYGQENEAWSALDQAGARFHNSVPEVNLLVVSLPIEALSALRDHPAIMRIDLDESFPHQH